MIPKSSCATHAQIGLVWSIECHHNATWMDWYWSQYHLNCNWRKSQSQTDGQLRRSWFYTDSSWSNKYEQGTGLGWTWPDSTDHSAPASFATSSQSSPLFCWHFLAVMSTYSIRPLISFLQISLFNGFLKVLKCHSNQLFVEFIN